MINTELCYERDTNLKRDNLFVDYYKQILSFNDNLVKSALTTCFFFWGGDFFGGGIWCFLLLGEWLLCNQ